MSDDLSKLSTDELLAMRAKAVAVAPPPEGDLSKVPTEQLLKMRDQAVNAPEAAPTVFDYIKSIPGKIVDKAVDEVTGAAKGIYHATVSPEGGPLAARIPLVGSAGQYLGEHFRAGVDYMTQGGDHSYESILADIQRKRMGEREQFVKEHPGADMARNVIGGLASVPLPMPGAGAAGALGVAERVAGTAGLSAADNYLQTSDTDKASQAATLGGGIQTGIEALPYIGRAAAPIAGPLADAGKWALKKGVSIFGGVAPQNVEYYLGNQAAVKGAKTLENLHDAVDTEIGKVNLGVDQARYARQDAQEQLKNLQGSITDAFKGTQEKIAAKVKDAKDALQQSFVGRIQGLKQKAIPVEHADEIVGLLRNEKSVLGSLSEQADDALARSGMNFEKGHVLELIDGVGKSLGVGKNSALIGEETVGAAKRLADLRDRIDAGFGASISAEDMRGILQQVRRDINFNTGAVEFNGALNGARKEFTGRISDVLKGTVGPDGQRVGGIPEYAAIMGRMHQLSSSLDEMGHYFNTREQALASLQTLVGGKGAKATIVNDVLNRYAKATGNEQIVSRLGEFQDATRVLGNPLEREALRKSLPEYRQVGRAQEALAQYSPSQIADATETRMAMSPQTANLATADKGLTTAQQDAARYAGWSPASSESRLKSVMGGRSIENARTIQALSDRTGLDFTKMLKDRNVADAFEKGYMNGSRNVNLWSIIGSLFGGKALSKDGEPIMKVFGGVVGGTIDRAGPKMTQKALDAFMAIRDSRYLPALENASKNGQAALFAQHAMLLRDPEYRRLFDDQGGVPSQRQP